MGPMSDKMAVLSTMSSIQVSIEILLERIRDERETELIETANTSRSVIGGRMFRL